MTKDEQIAVLRGALEILADPQDYVAMVVPMFVDGNVQAYDIARAALAAPASPATERRERELALAKRAVEACRSQWSIDSDEGDGIPHSDDEKLNLGLEMIRVVEAWDALDAAPDGGR